MLFSIIEQRDNNIDGVIVQEFDNRFLFRFRLFAEYPRRELRRYSFPMVIESTTEKEGG